MTNSSLKNQGQRILRLTRYKMLVEIAVFALIIVAIVLFSMLSAPAYVGYSVALYGGIFTNLIGMTGLIAMRAHIRQQLKPFDTILAPNPEVVRIMKETQGVRFTRSASRWVGLVVWCLLMMLGYLWFCDPEFHAAWEPHKLRLFVVAAGASVVLLFLTLVFYLSDKKLTEIYAKLDQE